MLTQVGSLFQPTISPHSPVYQSAMVSTVSAISTTDTAGSLTLTTPVPPRMIDTVISLSPVAVVSVVSIVSGVGVESIQNFYGLLLRLSPSLAFCFYRKYVNMRDQIAVCQPFQLDFNSHH